MIRDYTNHSPVGIQRAHCSSPCFLFPLLLFTFKFFYFFFYICAFFRSSFIAVRSGSAPLCPVWLYICVVRQWYITKHPAFPIPCRSGLQLNPHRWVDTHTQTHTHTYIREKRYVKKHQHAELTLK